MMDAQKLRRPVNRRVLMKSILKNLDLKGWRYKGRKMTNPLLIAWRLLWWVPMHAFLIPACLCAWAGFGRDAAEGLWKEVH